MEKNELHEAFTVPQCPGCKEKEAENRELRKKLDTLAASELALNGQVIELREAQERLRIAEELLDMSCTCDLSVGHVCGACLFLRDCAPSSEEKGCDPELAADGKCPCGGA